LYLITTNQAAIGALFRVMDEHVGNLPPPPRGARFPATNIRNTSSPHWRGWLKPEIRCLVPADSFAAYAPEPDPRTGKKDLVWFTRDDARPLFSRRIATKSRGFVVALDRWLRLDETGSGGITMHTLATGEAPRFAGLVRWGVCILATLVPIIFLLRLFALTLYSIPESDDFCFTYSNLTNGFAGTVWSFYQNAIGRIVPLVLMQVPAAISGVTGIDYFITYVATLASFEIGFAAAMVFVAFRLWPQGSIPQNVCFAAALAATILSGVPSLREMLYWLPGGSVLHTARRHCRACTCRVRSSRGERNKNHTGRHWHVGDRMFCRFAMQRIHAAMADWPCALLADRSLDFPA
jgi:hypothetical protein